MWGALQRFVSWGGDEDVPQLADAKEDQEGEKQMSKMKLNEEMDRNVGAPRGPPPRTNSLPLPTALELAIAQLAPADWARCAAVCREWRATVTGSSLWRRECALAWPSSIHPRAVGVVEGAGGYKRLYERSHGLEKLRWQQWEDDDLLMLIDFKAPDKLLFHLAIPAFSGGVFGKLCNIPHVALDNPGGGPIRVTWRLLDTRPGHGDNFLTLLDKALTAADFAYACDAIENSEDAMGKVPWADLYSGLRVVEEESTVSILGANVRVTAAPWEFGTLFLTRARLEMHMDKPERCNAVLPEKIRARILQKREEVLPHLAKLWL